VINKTQFFGIVFQGNPERQFCGQKEAASNGQPLRSRFSQLRATTPVQ
jgi:hypothetical protein